MDSTPSKKDSQPLRRISPTGRTLARLLWAVALAVALTSTFFSAPLTYAIQTSIAIDLFSEPLALLGWQATTFAAWTVIVQYVYVVIALIVAFLLAWRRPDDWVALLTGAVLVMFGAANYGTNIYYVGNSPAAFIALTAVYGLLAVSANWLLLVFPDGQFYPRWTFLTLLPIVPLAALDMLVRLSIGNVDTIGSPVTGLLALWTVFGMATQILRYRVYLTLAQKQQVKYVVAGMGIVIGSLLLLFIIDPLITPFLIEHPLVRMIYRMLFPIFFIYLPLTFCALTLMNAILRRNLWQVDFTINRSLGIAFVAIILTVGTFVLLATFDEVFLNPAGVAALLILITVSFNPVRRLVQWQIDRRFYRLRYPVESFRLTTAARPEVTQPGKRTGQSLDGWELLDYIGRGSTSEVYKGYASGQIAAVKLLPNSADPEARTRFSREADILEELNHANIVRLIQHGSYDGGRYLVMDYVEGETLRQYLEHTSPLPLDQAFIITRDVAAALDYIHNRGVIHRDLKPSNIMLVNGLPGKPRRAILMDFGIAKIDATQITGSGTMGTIDYMAPEQIQSSGSVSPASDVYALGVILFEMLTGFRPFRGNPGQVLFAHLMQPAPDPRVFVPNMPAHIVAALLRALAKHPEDRYTSAGAFAEALEGALKEDRMNLRLY